MCPLFQDVVDGGGLWRWRVLPASSYSSFRCSPSTAPFVVVRCLSDRAGDWTYSPLTTGRPSSTLSSFTKHPPADMVSLFKGCDYHHWLVVIHESAGKGCTKPPMIDCYIQTLAKVLGSSSSPPLVLPNSRFVLRFLLFPFLSSFCFHGFGGRRIGKECVDVAVGSYMVLSKESTGCCELGHDAGWFLQNFYQTFGEHWNND
ncbi:hypothetical protein JHK85_014730 [Glycine max]|nr:hypothetical protein JHK85_014730 [Glycine max]